VRRVAITGAAGIVGSVLSEGLADDYELLRLDRRRLAGGRRLDMRRLKAVERAFAGVESVVDLAVAAPYNSDWQAVYRHNLPLTTNALEAARRAGVQRVILASSNHVTGLYEGDEPYASVVAGRHSGLEPESVPPLTTEAPVRPDGPYGLGKVLAEAAGRYYSERCGLSVLCLRIGTVMPGGRPTRPRHLATWLSHGDLVRLVRCCIEASPALRFGVYYGVSANRWRFWDLERAREEIGFEPLDNAERWRDEVAARPEAGSSESR
jgi:nucleoside-diphosphate-sugar epimerase